MISPGSLAVVLTYTGPLQPTCAVGSLDGALAVGFSVTCRIAQGRQVFVCDGVEE